MNSVSKNAHTLINECPIEDRERVFKMYLNRNWTTLSQCRLPWFLPEHLGGLGLPTFPDYIVEKDGKVTRPWVPTDVDLRLAAAVHKLGEKISKRPEGVSWKVWAYAQRRLKDFVNPIRPVVEGPLRADGEPLRPIVHEDYQVMEEDDLMGKLCIEALFTQELNMVYKEEQSRNKVLRLVEAMVDRAKKIMGKVEPFTPNTLASAAVPDELRPLFLKLSDTAYVESTFIRTEEDADEAS